MMRFSMLGLVVLLGLMAASEAPGESSLASLVEKSGFPGGVAVHVGCGDGAQTPGLRLHEKWVVQGLDRSPEKVRAARERFHPLNVDGKLSVRHWEGGALPYNDRLVNVLVVEDPEGLSPEEMLRVLVPRGTLFVRRGNEWEKTVKPVPAEQDDWTHSLYDATGNAVSRDRMVAPPKHLQWFDEPRFGRQHDHMSSFSALVSEGGRIYSIADESSNVSILLPPRWMLTARDAFNGSVLWKREIPEWWTVAWPMKLGPSVLAHRLVAQGGKLFVTLGLHSPVSVLDGKTGKTLATLGKTAGTREFVVSGSELYAVVNPEGRSLPEYKRKGKVVTLERNRIFKQERYTDAPLVLKAIDHEKGKVLWEKKTPLQALSLSVDGKNAVFHDFKSVVCLDRKTGKERWKSEPVDPDLAQAFGEGTVLVLSGGVVLFSAAQDRLTALDLADGKILWSGTKQRSGHKSPQDIFVINGVVWTGQTASGGKTGTFTGRDLRTGKVLREFDPDVEVNWFHHRCHRGRATDRFILASRTGVEFIDIEKEHWTPNHWVRGACLYGIMPANGLLYAPPHPCACYLSSKLSHLNALSSSSGVTFREPEGTVRLRKGPAFDGKIGANGRPGDWPQFRRDVGRSGSTECAVPSGATSLWKTDLGGKPSRLVVAEGKLFVASVDRHLLHALDAETGKESWKFAAAGRIDSPPSVVEGRVLFGSADGWIYALRATDGALIWKFRAAPEGRQMMARGQLASPWPVHGSVLVREGRVYALAGRSRFVDGGLSLVVLDCGTGALLLEKRLTEKEEKSGKEMHAFVSGLDMPPALSDILSADDAHLFLSSQILDFEGNVLSDYDIREEEGIPHLFIPTGFLDDTWFHRTYWVYGPKFISGWNTWYLAGQKRPAGRILVLSKDSVLGYGRQQKDYHWSTPLDYHLFRLPKEPKMERVSDKKRTTALESPAVRPIYQWSKEIPFHARALVLADRTLFAAGPPVVIRENEAWDGFEEAAVQAKLAEQAAMLRGEKGSLLWAVDASTGERREEIRLESVPVFDGMAAANGKLYVALENGKVVCLGK